MSDELTSRDGNWRPRPGDPAGPPTEAAPTVGDPPAALGPVDAVTIGPFELLEVIGRGGMGLVYKAHDPALGRVVAIKQLAGAAAEHPHARDRFLREGKAAARLDHRHIVPIYDISVHAERLYYVMKYVPGGSLARGLARFRGDGRAAAALIAKVARAVHHAHQRGVLHRDLKPGNILLDEDGEPLVADFGLAKLIDAGEELTQTGAALGTPAYMAPEQRLGRLGLLGYGCDVWALGITLHELVTGRRPDSTSATEPTDAPPPAASPTVDLDPGLRAIVDRCLQEKPADRYPTAAALADDLEAWLRGELALPAPPPPPRGVITRRAALRAGVGGLAALAGGAGAWAVYQRSKDVPGQLRRELAAGGPVPLLDGRGRPRWSDQPTPRMQLRSQVEDGQPVLSVGRTGVGLLELLVGPAAEGFRFIAEVRHDSLLPNTSTAAGLYVGRSFQGLPGQEHHCFICLSFDDQELRPAADRKEQAPAQLEILLAGSALHHGELQTAKVPPQPGRWHELMIEHRPELVNFEVDGQFAPASSMSKVLDMLSKKTNGRPPAVASLRPGFRPTEGVGLFVANGWASFRNVRLEPLPQRP